MIIEAIRIGRFVNENDFLPVTDTDQLARWFDKHETVKDYHRKEVLNEKRWKKVRLQVLKRDRYECAYPDSHHSKRLQVHHLEPLHSGGDPYALWGLVTLCAIHHALMHPGLTEAYEEFRKGNKQAFTKYIEEEHQRKTYDPTPQAHIVRGIVIERERHANLKRTSRVQRESPQRPVQILPVLSGCE